MIQSFYRLLRSNTDAFVNVRMRGRVYNDMHNSRRTFWTTLAVNYILPFNSSTPKIDGYYNSSILATAKKKKKKERKKKTNNSASISQMRRLSSGWDQARKSTLTTAKSWTFESAEVTVHTAYSQHCHGEKQNKESHISNTALSQRTDTIPSGYLFTLFTNDTEPDWLQMQEKSLCFSSLLHTVTTTNKKRMGTIVHFDRYFHHPPPPPVWQLVGNGNHRTTDQVRNN